MMLPVFAHVTSLHVTTLVAFGAAVAASLSLTPPVIHWAAKRGLYEMPRGGERGPRRQVSRLGGIVVFLSTVIGLFVAQLLDAIPSNTDASRVLPGLILGGTVTFLLGVYDDVRGASPRLKLVVQMIAALIVFTLGTRIEAVTVGDAVNVQVGWTSLPLTVLWIVGVTNAFNLIDGMDGLATGIALVVLTAVSTAAMILGNMLVVVVSLVLVGSLLGFLRYNVSPARIFLGDGGSLFTGFALATLTVHGSLKSTTAVLVAIPIFTLAVPLLDTSVAIMRRLLRGTPLFGADARHIHHRLLASGLTPARAALTMWVLSGMFAVYGLSIAFAPRPLLLALGVVGGVFAAVLVWVGVRRLEYVEFAEAAVAVMRRGGGVRRDIRDRIHARELADIVPMMTTLNELNALLMERRFRFGFTQIEVNRMRDLRTPPAGDDLTPQAKLDYPLRTSGFAMDETFWLQIWSPLEADRNAHSAVRVARVIAPVLETWLEENPAQLLPGTHRPERRRAVDREIPLEPRPAPEAPWSPA